MYPYSIIRRCITVAVDIALAEKDMGFSMQKMELKTS